MTNYFFADLVRERSYASGSGPLMLEGALDGYRPFAGIVPPGAYFYYAIAGVSFPRQWETGIGSLNGNGQLERAALASSDAGATVDFSAGLKTVSLTVAADWFSEVQDAMGDPGIAEGTLFALGDASDMRGDSELPAEYPLGQSAYLTGTGFPFIGQVITLRYTDGSGFQRNIGSTSGGAQRTAVRYMNENGWSAWDGVEYTPVLLNGWTAHATFTADPYYMRDIGGMVHLSGNITGGTQDNNTILYTLPAGFRPSAQQYFACRSGGATVGVYVRNNGDVVLQAGPTSWISLSGISFAADR